MSGALAIVHNMSEGTVAAYLDLGRDSLARNTSVPDLEAQVLLAAVLHRPRSFLFAHPEKELSNAEQQTYRGWLQERRAGKPIAYILGTREFWSMSLTVNEQVLIPRPETELLVETTLDVIPAGSRGNLLELGTGSGAISLAIKKERPDLTIRAIDNDKSALSVARGNGEALNISVDWRFGDWLDQEVESEYVAIVSNPPYVASTDPHLTTGDVAWEPRSALDGGQDGLGPIRTIVATSPRHLIPGGYLLLEHGYDQREAVQRLMSRHGFSAVRTKLDLEGNPRVTLGQTPPRRSNDSIRDQHGEH